MSGLFGNDAVLWDILITSIISTPILLFIYRKSVFGSRGQCPDLATGIKLFFLGAGLSVAFRWLMMLAGGLGYKEDVAALLTGNILLEILVLLVMSPLLEELLFRGVIYERLKMRISPRAAFVVSSLMFGLYHGNLSQGIYGFFMGLVLAWTMERYRNVAAPLLIHIGANAAALLLELVFLL